MIDSKNHADRARSPKRERGVTSLEYALLGSLIAVVIVAAVSAVGSANNIRWMDIANKVAAAIS